jgi:hypothetical protein
VTGKVISMGKQGNYILRRSGRDSKHYYIDNQGYYKVSDIAKISGIELPSLISMYKEYAAEYCRELDVYYFDSAEKARKLIEAILKKSGQKSNERMILLTDKEIEYIRLALINEGSNTIRIDNRIKDEIFKKLNV